MYEPYGCYEESYEEEFYESFEIERLCRIASEKNYRELNRLQKIALAVSELFSQENCMNKVENMSNIDVALLLCHLQAGDKYKMIYSCLSEEQREFLYITQLDINEASYR
jgi:hypothetical protein